MNQYSADLLAVADRPSMMLLTRLGTGSFLVQGYPSGPTVYVNAEDAGPLREALAAATTAETVSGSAYSQIAAPPIVRPRVNHLP